MTAKSRRAHIELPAMPLSELPMMKALLALTAGGNLIPTPAIKGAPQAQLTTLRLSIIDKLQVLALRRPQAMVIIAQVLDALLNEQLKVLDEDDAAPLPPTRADRSAPHRSDGR